MPRPLISAERIQSRIAALARDIERDYEGLSLVVVCVLKGAFVFTADLLRELDLDVRVEFLGVKSYGNSTKSSGDVQITQDLTKPISGAHVLVVEDIVDTGLTCAYLLEQLRARHPASVRLCSLLHKPARTVQEVPIDYLGFTIDDVFVVGYGLDHAQQYRHLADLCVLENAPAERP